MLFVAAWYILFILTPHIQGQLRNIGLLAVLNVAVIAVDAHTLPLQESDDEAGSGVELEMLLVHTADSDSSSSSGEAMSH